MVENLFDNHDFQEVIDNEFLTLTLIDKIYSENIDSEPVRAEIKARSILRKFLYDIIEEAKMLKQEIKGE